jgi:hypothetical protein
MPSHSSPARLLTHRVRILVLITLTWTLDVERNGAFGWTLNPISALKGYVGGKVVGTIADKALQSYDPRAGYVITINEKGNGLKFDGERLKLLAPAAKPALELAEAFTPWGAINIFKWRGYFKALREVKHVLAEFPDAVSTQAKIYMRKKWGRWLPDFLWSTPAGQRQTASHEAFKNTWDGEEIKPTRGALGSAEAAPGHSKAWPGMDEPGPGKKKLKDTYLPGSLGSEEKPKKKSWPGLEQAGSGKPRPSGKTRNFSH